MLNKVIKAIIGGVIGAAIGAGVGYMLFNMLTDFFGKTWSVEAGGPVIVIYSPIFIPMLVGLITGAFGKMGVCIAASIFSGIAYIIIGVIILFVAGILSVGWGGITAILILAGLLCGGGTIVVVIIGD